MSVLDKQEKGINVSEKSAKIIVGIVSTLVLGLVCLMYFVNDLGITLPFDTSGLPKVYTSFNATVAVLLVAALVFIKKKNITAHKYCMMIAVALSAMFLITYVMYHSTNQSTSYGGEGVIKIIYLLILLTHIVLAAVILPFIMMVLYWALANKINTHRKVAKWVWPVWFYVAVTGVVIYIMISPYYT